MKKLVKLLVAFVMMTTLCACGGGNAEEDNTFVVGMECAYAPFNWQTATETETVVLNRPTNKSPRLHVFTGKFYQTLREALTRILVKLFQKCAEEETL